MGAYVAIYSWERYGNGGARIVALAASDMPSAIAEAEGAAGGGEELVAVFRIAEAHITGDWPADVKLRQHLSNALTTPKEQDAR